MNNILVSILVANYNNAKFIDQCILSILNQSYENIEIIFHDDCSSDNSLEVIKKYKKVKLIKNLKRGKYGSLNQINAYYKCFKKSKGKIIFFLDSDDYFTRNKIKNIVNYLSKNKNINCIYDLPIVKFENKKILVKNKKNFLHNYWPYIPPQSCISVKRKVVKNIFSNIKFNNFFDIWMDFRVAIYFIYKKKNFKILNKNLTFYRKSNDNVSSGFKFLSNAWWKRRSQAHNYIKYFFVKNNIPYKKNLDFYITRLINFLNS